MNVLKKKRSSNHLMLDKLEKLDTNLQNEHIKLKTTMKSMKAHIESISKE